jgi:hypothetical protein
LFNLMDRYELDDEQVESCCKDMSVVFKFEWFISLISFNKMKRYNDFKQNTAIHSFIHSFIYFL